MSNQGDSEQFTGLILLSGVDKPGITQALFETLSPFSITILDIEQVVIKDRLILTTLIRLNPAHQESINEDLQSCAVVLDVDIATMFSYSDPSLIANKDSQMHVVILSKKMEPSAIAQISSGITKVGGNIERAARIASTPVTAIEFLVSGVSQKDLTHTLSPIAASNNVDIAVQPGGLARHARKLIQLDVDSTLIQQEVIDLLAAKAGVEHEVSQITARAMAGEIDFKQSLKARVLLLKGLPESVISEVQSEILLTSGARTLISTLHKLGHTVAVVSGGFIDVIAPLIGDLGIKPDS
jgi:phosphoserine phosphatase